MSSKFKDIIATVRDKKEVAPGRESRLEEGDFKALVIAAFEVFGPVLLGMLAVFALIILVIVLIWH